MSYANPNDVSVDLGRPAASVTETAQWQSWIDRVERDIARGFRRAGLDLADSVLNGDPSAADVVDVVVGAVVRKIQNPRGLTSVTRSIDDASITERDEAGAAGLYLTDEDWRSLLPFGRGGAFSTRPGFEPDTGCDPLWM